MIMDLLDNNLNDMFKHQGRKFDVKTTCTYGIQMLKAIQQIHA